MRTYWRILSFAKPFRIIAPVYLGLIIFHTVFRIINFTALIPILQILFNENIDLTVSQVKPVFAFSDQYFINLFKFYLGDIIGREGKIGALYFICGILIGSIFLANIFQYFASLIQATARIRAITNLRIGLYGNLTQLDLQYFTDARKGDIMTRVTTDIQQIESTVVNSLKALLKEPILIIGFFLALFRISAELTLYTLLLIPLSGGLISYIGKRLKRRARKTQESLSRLTSILEESITGMRIMKAFAARSFFMKKFSDEVQRYGRHNFRMAAKNNLSAPLSEFLGVFFLSAILLIGGQMVLGPNADLKASEFIVFLIIFSQVLNPAKSISSAFTNVQRGIASGERVFHLMDQQGQVKEIANPGTIGDFQKEIKFDNVSFYYDERKVLDRIDLVIPKGKVVALVGPSGAGKSTIADLIPRFHDPGEGKIMIDGRDIRELRIDDLRKLTGYVSQEPILFNDTVFHNIAFGDPHSSLEDVIFAAKTANAHDFIEQLENGYHTPIGERGLRLSGGQRQRISIARAILKNPAILILDEATSALDSESEQLVKEALVNLMANRTTLVIAHRLSTIQHADQIIVLETGRVVETGTHELLIKKKGIYNRLIQLQSTEGAY